MAILHAPMAERATLLSNNVTFPGNGRCQISLRMPYDNALH